MIEYKSVSLANQVFEKIEYSAQPETTGCHHAHRQVRSKAVGTVLDGLRRTRPRDSPVRPWERSRTRGEGVSVPSAVWTSSARLQWLP